MSEFDNEMRVVIVDGFGVGAEIAHELFDRNVECFHLHSMEASRLPTQTLNTASYTTNLGYLGNARAAAGALAMLRPDAVVAGSSSGVAFAEDVANTLGLRTNRAATGPARRDKQSTLDLIQRAHLQAHSQGPATVVGRRFILNTVSVSGQHYISDAWRMTVCPHSRNAIAPKELQLVDLEHGNGPHLADFTRAVLTALGIENGPAQTDVAWTRNGPMLIETGAHLMDISMDRRAHRAAVLPTQANVFAEALTLPSEESRWMFSGGHYQFRKHMAKVFFSFDEEGTVRGIRGLAKLRTLASFQAHDGPLVVADPVRRSDGLHADGGVIHLVHDSADQITHDVQTIREWESGGELYDVAGYEDTCESLIPRALSMMLLTPAHAE